MKKSLFINYILIVSLFLLFFPKLIFAAVDSSRPANYNDSGVGANQTYAYDNNVGTYTFINVTTGNLSYFQYNIGSHSNSEDIKQVGVFFDVQASNTVDDQWGLQYSDNNGSSWIDLRSLSTGDLSRQILNYSNINNTNNSDKKWYWNNISNMLKVRVVLNIVNTIDNAFIYLYETWANATYDAEGPSINLESPENFGNRTNSAVMFYYNVSDALSRIKNCSLIIGGQINLTNSSVGMGVSQNFTQNFSDGVYQWSINCTDNSTVYNRNSSETRTLTVDTRPPVISSESPANNAKWNTSNIIVFKYNVTDISSIRNCTLIINSRINSTNFSVQKNTSQNFTVLLENGQYTWSVNCTDTNNFTNSSETRNITVSPNRAPTVAGIVFDQNIDLNVASTKTVVCNSTVIDQDNSSDIAGINATLYHSSVFSNSSDDNSTHYSNNSCQNYSTTTYNISYTCSFSVWYYAKQGTWYCNVTARDVHNANGSGIGNTTINSLYGMNLSLTVLDYGNLFAGANSTNDVNITVTNFGNREIDITLDGYGLFNGDGLAMSCSVGTISIDYEKYSIIYNTDYISMTSLTDEPVQLDDFNLKPRNSTFDGTKKVYWKIGVPKPEKGNCTGFVTFSVVAS